MNVRSLINIGAGRPGKRPPDGYFVYARAMQPKPWIIFDADNTLWALEHLYDEARDEMCNYVAAKGFAAMDVEEFQQKRDAELVATYGYSACRFARSFEDTLLQFLPSSPSEDVRHVRFLALQVFERKATPIEGLEELLRALRPHFSLGIITAGERWVQERRLEDFHLREMFEVIDIVEKKTPQIFSDFCNEHGVDCKKSWVVGDSLNSDVTPARSAGLKAIWVRAKNWKPVEGHAEVLEDGLVAIDSLVELAKVPGLLQA